jgi:hypothetical protein
MTTRRWLAAISVFVAISALGADAPRPEMTEETLTGQVVPLTTALSDLGLRADAGAIEKQVVLRTVDGVLIPLIRDGASRALFVDPRVQSKDAELHVRRYAGVPYVQVTTFKIAADGIFRTPEYYCDVCTISVRYPQDCPCCQRPMEFRFRPDDH